MYLYANKEYEKLKADNKALLEALKRAERKLRAYVGFCDDDTELNNTILPMCQKLLGEAIQGDTEIDDDDDEQGYNYEIVNKTHQSLAKHLTNYTK